MDRLEEEETVPLDLPFKGTRDYLHGTDMFDALLRITEAKGPVVLVLRRTMRHPVDAVPIPRGVAPSAHSAEFHYTWAGSDRTIVVREDPGRIVTRRVPYDEEAITAGAAVCGTSLSSSISGSYSFIEYVVTLNKLLLSRWAPGMTASKWLFTRIELDIVPESPKRLDLNVTASIGCRIAKTAIRADGRLLGHIYFSSVPQ